MKIIITKISKVEVFFEMNNGNWTVAMVQTEKDKKPLSFRMCRTFGTEEWQFMRILQFADVKQSNQLLNKEIKVVLDDDLNVVGYGSIKKDIFFLFQNQEIKDYTENDLIDMASKQDPLLVRTTN